MINMFFTKDLKYAKAAQTDRALFQTLVQDHHLAAVIPGSFIPPSSMVTIIPDRFRANAEGADLLVQSATEAPPRL